MSLAANYPLQFLIAQFQGLLSLMSEPIRLAHIKPSFLRNRHSSIKVCSTLELLLKPHILFEFGKQSCELLF